MIALDKIKSELTPEVDQNILGFLSDHLKPCREGFGQVDLNEYPVFENKVIELAIMTRHLPFVQLQ